MFENPRINDDFLSDLLKRSKPWGAVPDQSLMTIVAILGRNERMWELGEDFIDGFAHTRYHAVFNSAWKLAENVEPSERWARALSYLYDRLAPYAFSIKGPLRLVNRWRPEPSNAKWPRRRQRGTYYDSMRSFVLLSFVPASLKGIVGPHCIGSRRHCFLHREFTYFVAEVTSGKTEAPRSLRLHST